MKIDTIRDFRRDQLSQDPARAAGEAALIRLASRLYALRISMRLTQQELADRSGIDQASISDVENGDANPTVRTLGRLASGLGVDTGALLDHAPIGIRFGSGVMLREGVKWEGQHISVTASSSAKAGSWPRLGPQKVKRVTVREDTPTGARKKVGAV